jgi:hypothetical protein
MAAIAETSVHKNPAAVPYVQVAAGWKDERFLSATSSNWVYQQADTQSAPSVTVQMGCAVSGVVLVENGERFPSVRYLTDLGDVQYRLAEVLTVAVENTDDQFVVVEPKRGWFGYGDSEDKALCQFSASLVEQLQILSERQNELSDSLRGELAQLQQVVIPAR